MYSGRIYTPKATFLWTFRYTVRFTVYSIAAVALYEFGNLKWLAIPWVPLSIVGIAVAFYLGFKNNAAYDRLWEARKIWGGIVNTSRSWGMLVLDFITNEFAKLPAEDSELTAIKRTLVYRHIAWLTTLRYYLRSPRPWEQSGPRMDSYRKMNGVKEYMSTVEEELNGFIDPEEIAHILKRKNPSVHLLLRQSRELRLLREKELIDDFRHTEMEKVLMEFFNLQGKCERIKNFPFPRQYATISTFFVWIFVILIPFGIVAEFEKLGQFFVWLTIPFSVLISWVFHTMSMIGDYSENPFEGLHNDVPITALSRTIEIDLREMLGEKDLPDPIEAQNEILT